MYVRSGNCGGPLPPLPNKQYTVVCSVLLCFPFIVADYVVACTVRSMSVGTVFDLAYSRAVQEGVTRENCQYAVV